MPYDSEIMPILEEKPSMAEADSTSSKSSTLDDRNVNKDGHDDDTNTEKPIQGMTEDQYPHGLKLLLLAGASIVAVFLIALDQVSNSRTRPSTGKSKH